MSADEKDLKKIVLVRLLKLNATVQGIIAGVSTALAIFVATIWLVLKGGDVVGPHLSLLGQFFIGYQVTFAGSVIGAAYGFICGFAFGYFVARIYNRIVDLRADKLQQHV